MASNTPSKEWLEPPQEFSIKIGDCEQNLKCKNYCDIKFFYPNFKDFKKTIKKKGDIGVFTLKEFMQWSETVFDNARKITLK